MRLIGRFMYVAENSSAKGNRIYLALFAFGLLLNAGMAAGNIYLGDRSGTAISLLGCMAMLALITNEIRALMLKRRGNEHVR